MLNVKKLTIASALPADQLSLSTNGTGVDFREYIGNVAAVLDSEAGTGTTPTMDVKLQDSADNSTFVDISGAVFAQVTDAGAAYETIHIDLRGVGRYVRAVATITGSTPKFICAVSLIGEKQVKA